MSVTCIMTNLLKINQGHSKATLLFSFYHLSHITQIHHSSLLRPIKQDNDARLRTIPGLTNDVGFRPPLPLSRASASARQPSRLILKARTETRDWEVTGLSTEGTFTPLLASPHRLLRFHLLGEFFHCPVHCVAHSHVTPLGLLKQSLI